MVTTESCKRLWASAMLQAISDSWTQDQRRTVLDWVNAEDNVPGGFKWICDIFDIDTNFARAAFYNREGAFALKRMLARRDASKKRTNKPGRTIIDEVVHG